MNHNFFPKSPISQQPVPPQTPPVAQGDVFMANSPRTSLTPGFLIRGNYIPYKGAMVPTTYQPFKYGSPRGFRFDHFMPNFVHGVPHQQFAPGHSNSSSSSSTNTSLDELHSVRCISPSKLLPPFSTGANDTQFGGPINKQEHKCSPSSPSDASSTLSDSPTVLFPSTPGGSSHDEGNASDPFSCSDIPPGVMLGLNSLLSTPPPQVAMPTSPMVSPNSGMIMCSPQYIQHLSPLELLRLVAQTIPVGSIVIPPSPDDVQRSPTNEENTRQWRGINLDGIPSHKTYSDVIHQLKLPSLEFAHLATDYRKGTARLELRFLSYKDALRFYAECLLYPVQFDDQPTTISWAFLPPISNVLAKHINNGATRVIEITFKDIHSYSPSDPMSPMNTSSFSLKLQEILSKVGPIESISHSSVKMASGTNYISYIVFFATLDAAICGIGLTRSTWPSSEVKYVVEPEPHVHKLEQQAALLYLGESPYETKRILRYSKEQVSEAITYQYLSAVLTAQFRGSEDNTSNRCICISRLPSNTKLLDVCNIVRGGMLESVRLLEDLSVCFVIFVEPTAAVRFWANYQMKRLNVNGERVRVGWGRNPGPLAPELKQVIDQGVTRNLCLKWTTNTDPLLKQGCRNEEESKALLDKYFSPFGIIEQIRIAPEVCCSFISYTDIKNTVQAVNWARESGKFPDFTVQYGKDRCATLPRPSEKASEATLIHFLRRSLLRSVNQTNRTFAPISPVYSDNQN